MISANVQGSDIESNDHPSKTVILLMNINATLNAAQLVLELDFVVSCYSG